MDSGHVCKATSAWKWTLSRANTAADMNAGLNPVADPGRVSVAAELKFFSVLLSEVGQRQNETGGEKDYS